ncbi:MAG: hypothetical protein ABWX68_10625 [Arthrobacter sp.]
MNSAFAYVGITGKFERAGYRRVVLTDSSGDGLPRWLMRKEPAPAGG